jgi:hypothetical protein
VSGTTVTVESVELLLDDESSDVRVVAVEDLPLVVLGLVVDVVWCVGWATRTATRLAKPPNPAAAATALLRLSMRSRARRSAWARALVGRAAAEGWSSGLPGLVMAGSSVSVPVRRPWLAALKVS